MQLAKRHRTGADRLFMQVAGRLPTTRSEMCVTGADGKLAQRMRESNPRLPPRSTSQYTIVDPGCTDAKHCTTGRPACRNTLRTGHARGSTRCSTHRSNRCASRARRNPRSAAHEPVHPSPPPQARTLASLFSRCHQVPNSFLRRTQSFFRPSPPTPELRPFHRDQVASSGISCRLGQLS